jgi:quercetin dioxygenase-like cupin family protein
MPKTPFHGLTSQLPAESLFEGTVSRSAIRTDGTLVVFNYVDASMPPSPTHDHPFDQLALIFDGSMEFTVDGTPYVVEPGGFLYIPAGLPHSGRLVASESVLNIDIFSPPREDYLHLVKDQPA